jgi:hypothetical protein
LGLDAADLVATDHRETANRESQEKLQAIGLAKELMVHKDQQLHQAIHETRAVEEKA